MLVPPAEDVPALVVVPAPLETGVLMPPELEGRLLLATDPALAPPALDAPPELLAPPDPELTEVADVPPVPVVEVLFEEQPAIMAIVVVTAGSHPRTLWTLIVFSS